MAAHLVNRELDPDIWDGETLKPHIRKALLRIAAEFMIGLGVEVSSSDITLTGSMANFNYTPESDIDLHILLDFSSIDDDDDLVRQFLMTKKSLWNLRHNIQVKGHDVEVYPQDESEPHHSTGVYSLIKDEWLVRPHREDPVVDDRAVEEKFQGLASMIDNVLSQQDRLTYIAAIREKLRNMRKTGLQAEGEFSVENLAFKKLRREGYLDRLADAELQDRDASLSVAQEGSKMKISKAKLQQIIKEEIERAVSEGEGFETQVLDRYGNPVKKLYTWEFALDDGSEDGSHPMSITHEGWALARADYKRELRKKGVSAPDEKIMTLNKPI